MAHCRVCKREMNTAASCTQEEYEISGRPFQRVRYVSEAKWAEFDVTPPGRCHDCGVAVGQLHHPGCGVEECPRCGVQAISCPCNDRR